MLFNSLTFFAFFAAVLAFRFILPWRFGKWAMVLASYVFYSAANPWYCLILLASTLVHFFTARLIHSASSKRSRKLYLLCGIACSLSLLGVFKYGDFFIANVNVVLAWLHAMPIAPMELKLPVGISFYTFQTMSYSIDVYRGKVEPERSFGSFALFVSYFPLLLAGPIERARNLLPQLHEMQKVSRVDLEEGFQRILWGLVKKVVLADRFGLLVNAVYGDPTKPAQVMSLVAAASAPTLLLATVAFSLQLYLDFSAYCDIALGVSRMLGIKLSENFNWPYLARNPSEFWSRWHMTMTGWFTDYLFAPLVGVYRLQLSRVVPASILTMTLIGLWHGAAWHYVLFGLLNGLAIAGYLSLRALLPRKSHGPLLGHRWWSRPVGMLLLSLPSGLAMIFFMAPDTRTALAVVRGILTHSWQWPVAYNFYLALVGALAAVYCAGGIFKVKREVIGKLPAPVLALAWLVLILAILYGSVDTAKFIYFVF